MNSKNTYIYIFHTQFRYCSYALCDVAFVLFTLIYWLHVCLLGARVSHWAKKGKKVPFNFVHIEKDKMIIKTTCIVDFSFLVNRATQITHNIDPFFAHSPSVSLYQKVNTYMICLFFK